MICAYYYNKTADRMRVTENSNSNSRHTSNNGIKRHTTTKKKHAIGANIFRVTGEP